MAKRGYKLQEFVAHSGNVNCLRFGKKTFRMFITGDDDHSVNVWSIGKPTPSSILSGHTGPIESVAFDSAELLVAAGASSGLIKMWDLEDAKTIRTLSGHKSYCKAVEFYPFGEFFASGSVDTYLKMWDIRKKECIHTYKGHTRAISTIRFTPDGRWVVSGGLDNVVKVWDLTAGKLLHDFKHEGHIRSIDFHPLEFLLATGSADQTVKFWDLETFEMIGSVRREATGVRSIAFHPDGRTLFCGLDDSLKVYSWEPVLCHDSIDMGWSTLGDLCIHDGKLLGGAYYRNSVGIWVADTSVIEPYGSCMNTKQNSNLKQIQEQKENAVQILGSNRSSNSSICCSSPDYDSKEIKNIYVDSEDPITTKKNGSFHSPEIIPQPDCKESDPLCTQKRSSLKVSNRKTKESASNNSFIAPVLVPHDSQDLASSRREVISTTRANPSMSIRRSQSRRPANNFDMEKTIKPDSIQNVLKEKDSSAKNGEDKSEKLIFQSAAAVAVAPGRTRSLVERFEKREIPQGDDACYPGTVLSLEPEEAKSSPLQVERVDRKVRVNNEDARTSDTTDIGPLSKPEESRPPPNHPSPVERFDGRRNWIDDASQIPHTDTCSKPEEVNPPSPVERVDGREKLGAGDAHTSDTIPQSNPEEAKNIPLLTSNAEIVGGAETTVSDIGIIENLMQSHDIILSTLRSRLTKLQVVRHFWQQNDIKGAINALKKLPNQSVQADVVSVLIERMEIFTLELFSSILPVLLSLLESKVERHANVSLEILLKLVAIFGPVVRSAVSARPSVGVDLHAEERIECCRQCLAHLQIIQNSIPTLMRRGGLLAKSAHQLNLVLQQ
ncbi:unnamed protein product [Cuscuta epithymum]|uniref:Katanin p80 WD40 repeat-containing subunit B1 homolog n=1 Tax=Cuscuta epithymum TaxID=186058 RepID=A0AAV0DXK7_9ASTE|nr:unnamed protein product [Cuscuta epithymum]